MTEIELLEKILMSVRIIQYTLAVFIGVYLGRMFAGK